MADAFVAGPDKPWGSRWVFAGGNQPAPEEIEAIRTGGKPNPLQGELILDQLKKQIEQVKAQGGDETQLKQAAESTLQGLDSAITALSGELESVRTNQAADPDGSPVAKPTPNVLGGAEYLSTLQGAKAASVAGATSTRAPIASVKTTGANPMAMDLTAGSGVVPGASKGLASRPDLHVIPGGLATGEGTLSGRLEGGGRLSKDEPGPNTDTFYPNGMPLSAVNHPGEKLGAGPIPTITGHVVPGSMQRDRLTSESLHNVANGIVGMAGGKGGEMRIRLNPGNLGELMIRVSTNGKDVGLKVQANDPSAKKIIEESLGALRDSLAQQSLALGRVDVTLASTSTSSDLNGQNSQSGSQSAFGGFDGQASANQGRFMDGSNSREDRASRSTDAESERSVSRRASARIAAMNSGGNAARAVDSSRLDVMA